MGVLAPPCSLLAVGFCRHLGGKLLSDQDTASQYIPQVSSFFDTWIITLLGRLAFGLSGGPRNREGGSRSEIFVIHFQVRNYTFQILLFS